MELTVRRSVIFFSQLIPFSLHSGFILTEQTAEFTRQVVSDGILTVSDVSLGKYAGRALGSVSVAGKDLVEALISAGHGRSYDGGARGSWCD